MMACTVEAIAEKQVSPKDWEAQDMTIKDKVWYDNVPLGHQIPLDTTRRDTG